MYRATPAAVKEVLAAGRDYDTDNMPNLAPYIRAANLIVDRVKTCASTRGKALTAAELTEIETWLAAFFYTRSDPIYQNKSTAGGGAGFVSDPVDPERYRAGAIALDHSGCLVSLLKNQRATAFWLGKPPSDQIAYVDRD